MSEFVAVSTKADLDLLDSADMVAGYLSGYDGAPEPGSDKSRGYWHGWRNGRVDGKYAQTDEHQIRLAREIVRASRAQ